MAVPVDNIQIDEPVATQISNAHLEITIEGELVAYVQREDKEKEDCCNCLPCEFVCFLIIAFIFLLIGTYVFFGKLIKN